MKKVLFVSNISRGMSNFSLIPMKVLNSLGYEFHYAADFTGMPDGLMEQYPNVHFHQINLKRFPFHPQNIIAYREMNAVIRKENIDAIHCNTPIGGVLGRLCGKACHVKPVIYTAHGFHFYKGAPKKNWILYYTAERLLAHWTDALVTMNQEDYENAKKFKLRNNGKAYFIHGVGIDTELYKNNVVDATKIRQELGLSESDIVCISMGDLIPRKNYGTAIKAIALCPNKSIHYLICGDGPELENLKNLAEENEVSDRVHFLGYRTDIKDLLKAADIFLFTSLQEGMPRSMMEAMACGLPCIAGKIRGNVDLLEDDKGGFLVDPTDENAVKEALEKMTNSNYRAIGQYNLTQIEKFSVEAVLSEYTAIYQEVLG